MNTFETFNLPTPLMTALKTLKFETPTPIQSQTIPLALEGHDILGSAQTGTGKTGAFGIPLIAQLLDNPQGGALVITPTRELATQVMKSLKDFLGKNTPIRTALIIGGEAMPKQLAQLKKKPRLVVGTPGRLNDHLRRGSLNLSNTRFLILDETDRMLDMGFSVQIEDIQKHLPEERQTLLFSATLPKNIMKLAGAYLKDPKRIAVGNTSDPAKNIKQEILNVKEAEKFPKLLEQLDQREGSVIVFVKTKYATEKMAKKIALEGHATDAIHGDLRHTRRERVIKAFRNQKYRILVATDVAARGIDIPHIEHVINYDLPQAPEDYIHRIGRTARAGAKGEAICFVAPSDRGKWRAIEHLMNLDADSDKEFDDRGSFKTRGKKPFKKSFFKKSKAPFKGPFKSTTPTKGKPKKPSRKPSPHKGRLAQGRPGARKKRA